MSYSTSSPPRILLAPLQGNNGLSNTGINVWYYSSTADAVATIAAAGYFTNAQNLGMAVSDLVLVQGSSNVITSHRVLTVTSTGADLSDGTTIGSTANAG